MFSGKQEFKQEKGAAIDPNRETLIIPTRTSVASVEISSNANQLTPYERIPADVGRAFALFGVSGFSFAFIAAVGASYPLLLAVLAVGFPLSAHALSKRLSKPLRVVLTMILLASLGTVGYSIVGEYQASSTAPAVTPNKAQDNFAENR